MERSSGRRSLRTRTKRIGWRKTPACSAASALTMLTDELEVRRNGEAEVLHVVMVDRRRA